MNIRRLEVSKGLPQDLAVLLLLEEADLDVVLGDLVAEEKNLLPARNWTACLRQPADCEVTFGF